MNLMFRRAIIKTAKAKANEAAAIKAKYKKKTDYCRTAILITSCRLFDSNDKKVKPVDLQEQEGEFNANETSTSTLALHEDSDKESHIPEVLE